MTMFRRMRLNLLVIGLAVAGCAWGVSAFSAKQQRPDASVVAANPDVQRLAAADGDFGFRLLNQLTKNQPTGNIFISPFSISEALMLTMNGAGGQTRADLANALGMSALTQDQVNAANSLLLPSLTNPDPQVQISIANALWAERGMPLNPKFVASSKNFYDADASTLDFASPDAAAIINAWVSRNTQGKIPTLVEPSDLAGAAAVLTNAVYFHGKWQSQFSKTETQNGPFYVKKGSVKSVPLMLQEGRFSYLDNGTLQAINLPYGAGRMSLYVLLPKPGTDVSSAAQNLTQRNFSKWIGAMKPAQVKITLPRFKADYQARLKAPLIALGMGAAFAPTADFSPMGLKGWYISEVIHKAVLDVDEQGTTAAAATGVIVTRALAVPNEPVEMRVDRPFICAIRDNSTGAILFAGVIRDPG